MGEQASSPAAGQARAVAAARDPVPVDSAVCVMELWKTPPPLARERYCGLWHRALRIYSIGRGPHGPAQCLGGNKPPFTCKHDEQYKQQPSATH
ncbi:unnamed protein product [Urochloa humidicola]